MIALSVLRTDKQNPAYRFVLISFTLKREENEY